MVYYSVVNMNYKRNYTDSLNPIKYVDHLNRALEAALEIIGVTR